MVDVVMHRIPKSIEGNLLEFPGPKSRAKMLDFRWQILVLQIVAGVLRISKR